MPRVPEGGRSNSPDGHRAPFGRAWLPRARQRVTTVDRRFHLAVASVLVATAALAGLGTVGPLGFGPLTALTCASAGTVAALAGLRGDRDDGTRRFVGTLGLGLGLTGIISSVVAIVALVPCGPECIRW